jgi:hypothetical protein
MNARDANSLGMKRSRATGTARSLSRLRGRAGVGEAAGAEVDREQSRNKNGPDLVRAVGCSIDAPKRYAAADFFALVGTEAIVVRIWEAMA